MFHNIAFSGGGSHTMAFLGSVKYLEETDQILQISNFIGASAGSFIALMLVLNIKYEGMLDIYNEYILKNPFSFPLKNIIRITKTFGLNDGKVIISIIESILEKYKVDKNITFLELTKKTGKNLIISVTNISQQKIEYLSIDTYPEMKITTAIRMTTAIPLLFEPVKYYEDLYVDSFVFNNFPIDFFKTMPVDTLGITLKYAHMDNKCNTLYKYISMILQTMFQSIYNRTIKEKESICVIPIRNDLVNFNFTKMSFEITEEILNELVEAGYNELKIFFTKNL
jgi:predicted acylesterase/phospholipase RssA